MKVHNVQLIRESLFSYDGIAGVILDGKNHNVGIHVTTDFFDTVWETKLFQMAFLAQKDLENLQNQFATLAPQAKPGMMTQEEKYLEDMLAPFAALDLPTESARVAREEVATPMEEPQQQPVKPMTDDEVSDTLFEDSTATSSGNNDSEAVQ